jgi:hypothetical protein
VEAESIYAELTTHSKHQSRKDSVLVSLPTRTILVLRHEELEFTKDNDRGMLFENDAEESNHITF